jgi:nucleotide-binding universal stress UspA family protein/CheY-like chemotaxis protein
VKILVGYDDGEIGRVNLSLARDYAILKNAFVYILTSMSGGESEGADDVLKSEEGLKFASDFMKRSGVQYETVLSVRGFSPGEDIVKHAEDKEINHIFLGIKKKSKTEKAILGSTVQYVLSKSPCPVTCSNFNLKNMTDEELLKDRRILIVDDEVDVLESVEEILEMCVVDTSTNFEEAKTKLENNSYDIAILDIMGVQGYEILQLTREKDIPTLMLTANALTPEHLKKSILKGADAYIPKEEMVNIDAHVADMIKARIKGKKGSGAWLKILTSFFNKSFGKTWKNEDKTFWESFDNRYRK